MEREHRLCGARLVRLVRGLGVHDRVHLAEQDLILPLDRKIALRLHLAREECGALREQAREIAIA